MAADAEEIDVTTVEEARVFSSDDENDARGLHHLPVLLQHTTAPEEETNGYVAQSGVMLLACGEISGRSAMKSRTAGQHQ